MNRVQQHCAYCHKRAKNTGGWRYAPIFCGIACEEEYRKEHERRLKIDPAYASQDRRHLIMMIIYLTLFGLIPFLGMAYILILGVLR